MADYRPWLIDIAIWWAELQDEPRVVRRMQEVLKWAGQVHRRRLRMRHSLFLEDESGKFPPHKALRIFEKYELVVAIHNAVCENTPPIRRLNARTYFRKGGAALTVDFAIYHWSRQVRRICDHQFNRICNIVRAVAADLKVKAPKLTCPESVVINVNPPADGRTSKLQKKPVKPRRKPLTPRQKEVLKTYSDCGRDAAAAARQLGVKRQYVSAVVKITACKLKPERGSRRSVGVDQKLPADRNGVESVSEERGPSDKGTGRKLRVKRKF